MTRVQNTIWAWLLMSAALVGIVIGENKVVDEDPTGFFPIIVGFVALALGFLRLEGRCLLAGWMYMAGTRLEHMAQWMDPHW